MSETTFWRDAFHEHGSDVLAFLASRLANRHDAEDLLQETFMRAIRSSGRLRRRDRVRSYLFTIAHRLSLNHLRRLRAVAFTGDLDTVPAAGDGAASESDGPDAEARIDELLRELAGARERLGPDLARAFDLGVVDKRPYAEIAELTGWSLAKVRVSIHRARRRMLRELGLDGEVQ